jgi:MOSC domain-containing protein YiiM
MAEIISIVYTPEKVPGYPKPFTRIPLSEATLVAGHGIQGDRKGGHPKRQLNVMCYETLAQMKREGFKVGPGEMGEQIVISGIDVDELVPGERIQLGADVCIEVASLREPCERFEAAQDKPLELAIGKVGVMARVITGGEIRVGDPVELVKVAISQ